MSLGTATIEVMPFPRNVSAADWLFTLTKVTEFLRDSYLAKRGEVEVKHTIVGDRVEIWLEPILESKGPVPPLPEITHA